MSLPEGLSTLWLASLLPVVQMPASHVSASAVSVPRCQLTRQTLG